MQELVYHRHLLPAAERYASRVLVYDGAYEASYAGHLERTLRACDAIRSGLGLKRGERYGVLALNSHEFLELYHAAYLGAGIINPLNVRLSADELSYILSASETEVVFVDAAFAALAAQLKNMTPTLRTVVLCGEGVDVAHDLRYEDLLGAAAPTVPPEPDEHDPAVLMYTGGTTGLPKGVLCTHRAEVLSWYHASMRGLFADERHVALFHLPMFHGANMVNTLAVPACGGAAVIVPRFDVPAVLDHIARFGVTHLTFVPTMLAMILDHPDFRPEILRTVRCIGYGASPMPAALLDRLQATYPNLDLVQAYGMTEASCALTLLTADDHRRGGSRLRSVGRALPGVDLAIRPVGGQEQDENLAPGEIGEVCARSGSFMTEYWNDPDATTAAFRGGWYRSGDMGRLDEDGYLYLEDRAKDMIISGGENIYSVEVENAIASHPDVLLVAVIGIPHELWGEQVHAIVVLRPGATTTEEQVIGHARERIAGYKVPKSVEFREHMALSGAMKPLKRDLRAPFWEATGWSRSATQL